MMKFLIVRASLIFLTLTLLSCNRRNSIVVYTALDREFSEPILDEFTRQTGIQVRAKYDTEANKSVGLTNLIIAERSNPRCDLFWNNEILNTLRLNQQGLLESYSSIHADDFNRQFYDSQHRWHGFAARARVFLVNTNHLQKDQFPTSIYDLTDKKWKGKAGIAKPLFGTTASHAACLFAKIGGGNAKRLFMQIKENVRVYAGNKQVARAVSAGQIDFGLTDTDDAVIEIEGGYPVKIVYPDQADGEMGTLFIPNTISLIKSSPNSNAATRLVDFLLSAQTEKRLAIGRSAQIPLNQKTVADVRVETPLTINPMQVDFSDAAGQWDQVANFLRQQFMAD